MTKKTIIKNFGCKDNTLSISITMEHAYSITAAFIRNAHSIVTIKESPSYPYSKLRRIEYIIELAPFTIKIEKQSNLYRNDTTTYVCINYRNEHNNFIKKTCEKYEPRFPNEIQTMYAYDSRKRGEPEPYSHKISNLISSRITGKIKLRYNTAEINKLLIRPLNELKPFLETIPPAKLLLNHDIAGDAYLATGSLTLSELVAKNTSVYNKERIDESLKKAKKELQIPTKQR